MASCEMAFDWMLPVIVLGDGRSSGLLAGTLRG
jgi:hypothetical protein